jgi:hypothetical protein
MIYIAYLSFHELATEEGQGNFSCVVDADGVDAAANKTADLIEALHQSSDAFAGIREIFLDEIVQINSMPSQGFLAHWQWAPGATGETVSTVLPGVDETYCEAFGPEPEDGADEDAEEGVVIEPFVTFE